MGLSPRCSSVSRKLTEVLNFSIVNLIVSCTLLRCVVNFSSSPVGENVHLVLHFSRNKSDVNELQSI